MELRPIAAVALALAGCSRESRTVLGSASAPSVPPPAAEEIGERCLDCHEDVVRSYRRTGMARAIEPIRAGELDGLEPVADAAGWSYRFESGEGGPRIVETWKGRPGVSARLEFAIGAGLMDRSYAASIGELLAFAPLEVVAHGASRDAALAPGHSIRPGLRFGSPIAEECLACHTDRLPPREYPLNLRPDPAAWSPSGISCAACHGDGEAHARWREADLAGERPAGSDPVVSGRGSAVESLSSCARCHLQGDASLLLEPGARGVPPPGGDLLAERAVFVAAERTEEIRFVSQVERLVLSPCFTGSSAAGWEPLTCVTCHDPHRSSFEPAGRRAVRDACGRCHAPHAMPCTRPPMEEAGRDCVDCHMRTTGVFDVAGVVIHDHFIRTDPGPSSPAVPLRVHESKDGKLALFDWPGRERRAHADDPGLRAMALAAAGRPDLALPLFERDPGELAARLATYHHLRGSILESALKNEEARAAYARALEIDPQAAETSVNLGYLLGKLGKPRDGLAVLTAVIERHPKAHTALRNRAVLRLQLEDPKGFAADLRAAFEIAPDAAVAAALAQAARLAGDGDGGDRWDRIAIELDPSRAPAGERGR